jgi:hypothetical protein
MSFPGNNLRSVLPILKSLSSRFGNAAFHTVRVSVYKSSSSSPLFLRQTRLGGSLALTKFAPNKPAADKRYVLHRLPWMTHHLLSCLLRGPMRVLPLLMSLFFGNNSYKYNHILSSLVSMVDMSFVVVSLKRANADNATVDVIFLATKVTNVSTTYLPWLPWMTHHLL